MPAWNEPLDGPWPDDFRRIRWGVYLRPDAATSEAQTRVHHLLAHQFGLIGGGTFMPHCTIKGFFLTETSTDDIVAALDPAMHATRSFPVSNGGPRPYGPGSVVLDVQSRPDGSNNDPLTAFATATFDAVRPLVHPDDTFTPGEPSRDRFHGHLTLSMADCPPFLEREVADYIDDLRPIGSPWFLARHIHLYAFTSAAWDGKWWESLRWRLLHAWRLRDA